jgi:hypothetical protein
MQDRDDWYIARDGRQVGPLSDRGMQVFARRGHLNSEDLVWRPGFDDWRRADDTVFLKLKPSPPEEEEPELPEQDGGSVNNGAGADPVSQKKAATDAGLSRLSEREFKRAVRIADIPHEEEEGVESAVRLDVMVPSVNRSLQSQQKASLYYLNLIVGAVGWAGVAALTFVIVITL